MKILFVSNLYPPNVCGGYERLCFSVADALAARGHTIGVLTSSYGGKSAEYPGHRVWRSLFLFATENNIYEPFSVSPERRADLNSVNVNQLHAVADEFKPDVVFVWNMYFFDAILLDAIERRFGDRAVYFVTDNWLISFFNGDFLGQYFPRVVFGTETDEDVKHRGVPFALRGRALFGSAYMERFYAAAGLRFASQEVIHNGVTLPDVPESRYRDRFLPVRRGALRLLFAGRIVDVKGVHLILEALPLITAALPDVAVSLDIVGDSQDEAYRARLDAIVERHGIAGMVRRREPVGVDELFALFQDHDIYLFPSLYEPFALTLIHALHAGVPTVASAVGGNTEIVHNRETGMLFRNNDAHDLARAVLALHREPLLRQRVARQARLVSSRFTFAHMVENIDRALRAVS